MMFVWGLMALAVIAWFRDREDVQKAGLSLLGMAIGVGPYCFLTYMMQVPSRHSTPQSTAKVQ